MDGRRRARGRMGNRWRLRGVRQAAAARVSEGTIMWGRALRWISLIATAVPLAALAAHVLELPNKLRLDGPLWLAVQQNLYRGWGPLVAPFEIAAIAAAWLLVYRARRRPPILAWTLAAAVCLSALL